MNKADLVSLLSKKTNTTKILAEEILDATLEIIQSAVAKGDEVKLVGFGSFSYTKRKPRKGRNPKTGEPITVPGGKTPKFKPGKEFKDKIN